MFNDEPQCRRRSFCSFVRGDDEGTTPEERLPYAETLRGWFITA